MTTQDWITVATGIGTVFIGLIAIVILCKIIGFLCTRSQKAEKSSAPVAKASNQPIANKQEIVAAVSAVIAEELGTDVSALRILSFKKL